jgi:hypothetical protein
MGIPAPGVSDIVYKDQAENIDLKGTLDYEGQRIAPVYDQLKRTGFVMIPAFKFDGPLKRHRLRRFQKFRADRKQQSRIQRFFAPPDHTGTE